MQNEIISTGKTIELAVEAGLAELGVTRDDVTVEVLETPVRRLFRSTPAKVRIVRDLPQENVAPVKPAPTPVVEKSEKAVVKKEKVVQEAPVKAVQKEQPVQKKNVVAPETTTERPSRKSTPRSEADVEMLNKKTQLASEFLDKVFNAMELSDVTIEPKSVERGAVLNISGENMSVLIGKRGETMEALSYLTSLVANSIGGNFEKMSLDIAGYREKREEDLTALAKRISANVLKSGRPYALEPMNPYERRIIHTAIGEIEGIASESQGDGDRRHIVIYSEAEGAPGIVRYNERRDRSSRDRGDNRRGGGRRDGRRDRDRDRKPKQPPIVSTRTEKVDDDTARPLFSKIEL